MPEIGFNNLGNNSLPFLDTAGFHLEETLFAYTAVAGDIVDEMFFRGNDNANVGTTAEVAIYDIIAGVIANQIGGSQIIPIVGGADAWFSSGPINIPLVAGTDYTIANTTNNSPDTRVMTGLPNGSHELRPANPLPDPWPAGGIIRGWTNCIYANVTNVGPPVSTIIYPCCAQLIT